MSSALQSSPSPFPPRPLPSDEADFSPPSRIPLDADDMVALVALLSLSDSGSDAKAGVLDTTDWQAPGERDAGLPLPVDRLQARSTDTSAAAAASTATVSFIVDEDESAPLPQLPLREYLAGLPAEARRGVGEPMWSAEASLRAAAGSVLAAAPSMTTASEAISEADGDVELARAEFDKFLARLPPDVATAARGLQELGMLDSAGHGGSEMESEFYRSYLELLASVGPDAGADAQAAAAEAIAGVKRRRGVGARGNGGGASIAHAPDDDATLLRELG